MTKETGKRTLQLHTMLHYPFHRFLLFFNLQLFEHEKEKMLSFKSLLSLLSASPEEALTDLITKAKQEYAGKFSVLSLTHALPQENRMYVTLLE